MVYKLIKGAAGGDVEDSVCTGNPELRFRRGEVSLATLPLRRGQLATFLNWGRERGRREWKG